MALGVRLGIGLLCVGLAAALLWGFRDAPALRPVWQQLAPAIASVHSLNSAPEAPSASVAGLRKCIVQGRLTYTNEACPAGSREQALTGGSVTVVTLPKPAPPPGAGASGPPNVRDLLVDPNAVDIKERRMEEVIGK